jgi:hypothetical protein
MTHGFSLGWLGALTVALALGSSVGCGPEVVRGSQDPGIDRAAMSTGIDKVDMDQMIQECLKDLGKSDLMVEWRAGKPQPSVALFPFTNSSTEHVESQLDQIANLTETWLVDAKVSVIDRRLQPKLIADVEGQQGAAFNPEHAAKYGRQMGAKFYVTGKLGANDERVEGARRVQYSFFMQAIEVETSVIKWQHRAFVTKMIR